jgi:hypothetical protein
MIVRVAAAGGGAHLELECRTGGVHRCRRQQLRVVPGSAVIGAGIALADVRTDRIGTTRPQGQASDVGAYEWIPKTATAER